MQNSKTCSHGALQAVPGRKQWSLFAGCTANPSLLTLVTELRRSLAGCRTVLDVGCGHLSPLRFLSHARLTGLDAYEPALEEARKNGTHDEFILGDVTHLKEVLPGRHFDACVALDVIEHLRKEQGQAMVQAMEGIAARAVVIFTPNGFIPQRSKEGDLQEHLSGWTTAEMRSLGYEVLGMYGPKAWRGEYHRVIRRPRVFWVLASILAHYAVTRARPEKSAALYCVKRLTA
jgi:SAM-dependent methyltransferase